MRIQNTSAVVTQAGIRPSLRNSWRSVCAVLRRIRDWPDPDSPYSPFLTVLVAAVFVLTVLASR